MFTAVDLFQFNAYFCVAPSVILSVMLFIAIRQEQSMGNKYELYNPIFIFYSVTNFLLAILFTLIQPVFLTSQNLLYIVIVGPLSFLPEVLIACLFGTMMGILTLQVGIPPITLIIRYLGVLEIVSMKRKPFKCLICILSLLTVCNIVQNTRIYNFPSDEDNTEHYVSTVLIMTGSNYGFIISHWDVAFYILIPSILLFIGFFVCVVLDYLIIRKLKTFSLNRFSVGYTNSVAINRTLLVISIQALILETIPLATLSITMLMDKELGVRAIPTLLGVSYIPLISSYTILISIKPYRRNNDYILRKWLQKWTGTTVATVAPVTITQQSSV